MTILIYTEEVWKELNCLDVKPNLYEISNYGNIRNVKTGKILKAQVSGAGYYRLELSNVNVNNTGRRYSVHRLVALTFVPNSDTKTNTVVNHIDGDKLNNFYANLEWTTPKENIRHAVENKLHWQYVGESNPNCKFTNKMIWRIYTLAISGIKSRTVCEIIKREYPQLSTIPDYRLITYVGRIRRKDRFAKVIDNMGSTTIKRNID